MNQFLPFLRLEFLPKFKTETQTGTDGPKLSPGERYWSLVTGILSTMCLFLVIIVGTNSVHGSISPLMSRVTTLRPLVQGKSTKEVFGFAPYWTFNNLDTVDFSTLTTFSYFGVPVQADGTLDTSDQGYATFVSDDATRIFQKAHSYGTRVVLTITQMDNATIQSFLSNPTAQNRAVSDVVRTVKDRGIDGINVDFEYIGDASPAYQAAFSSFVATLTNEMHSKIPESKVTVSVYALSAREQKLTDIHALAQSADGIFMMAYDFAATGSDVAMPTAPLHGSQNGSYAYDVASAVTDFLKVMPASKLILGVPYYGYNYSVYTPRVKAATTPYWAGEATVQTYAVAQNNDTPNRTDIDSYKTGWDSQGEVGYKAYHLSSGGWRIIFLEDVRSLGMKYDFALNKNLGGVGMWALGFDTGKPELWALLREKFGTKYADSRIVNKQVAYIN